MTRYNTGTPDEMKIRTQEEIRTLHENVNQEGGIAALEAFVQRLRDENCILWSASIYCKTAEGRDLNFGINTY